jgi:hypothetical protein
MGLNEEPAVTVDNEAEGLRQALRRMPVAEPRPGFVDRVLANATAIEPAARQPTRAPGRLRHLATRWETWMGAALGGAVAAALTIFLLNPIGRRSTPAEAITLALHEARDVDVLIDSDRALTGATIRIAVTGGVALDGFENEHEIRWQADLERGSNLLSLPLVARTTGKGQLVATIEHAGRTRQVIIALDVRDKEVSRS